MKTTFIKSKVHEYKKRVPKWDQKIWPSKLLRWLASKFSSQYHWWIKHYGYENEGNDHQLRKFLIVKWILFVNTLKIGVEQYGEYAYRCQEVRLWYNNNKMWSKFANQIIHENYQITSSPRFLWKSTGLALQSNRLQDLNWI